MNKSEWGCNVLPNKMWHVWTNPRTEEGQTVVDTIAVCPEEETARKLCKMHAFLSSLTVDDDGDYFICKEAGEKP